MSRGQLQILVCELYRNEIKALDASQAFPEVEFSTYPARCGRPPLSAAELRTSLADSSDRDRVILFGGCCLSQLDETSELLPECRFIRLENCCNLIAGSYAINHYLRDGGYLVTPGWLQNWRNHLNVMGFYEDQTIARNFFSECIRSIILLDTGIQNDVLENLTEFADFLQVPFSVVPVGLDLLHLRIEHALSVWQAENFSHTVEILQKNCADYVMALDMLDLIAQSYEEEDIIGRILTMFQTLFAASGVAFVSMSVETPGRVTIRGEFSGNDTDRLLAQATELTSDYTLPDEMKGRFLFKVQNREQTLGIIIIDGLTLPKYREQYLSLALTTGELSGIILKNARIFKELNVLAQRVSVQRDELQQAYSDLRDVKALAFQQEKMTSIGQLAAGVAHEINNPLGFITSNLGTLEKYLTRITEFMQIQSDCLAEIDDPELRNRVSESFSRLKIKHILQDTRQLISESRSGGERVHKIIRDLIHFSCPDDAAPNSVNINDCLERTISMVASGLTPLTEIRKNYGTLPSLRCYPHQLNHLFMNLLVNAAHALDKQGNITISTFPEEEAICISIADTGCGIPEENLPRIFEPFFTTREVGMGTGLGLSLAYDIVKRHKGDIFVTSEVGAGTTFTVRLPLAGVTLEKQPSGDHQ